MTMNWIARTVENIQDQLPNKFIYLTAVTSTGLTVVDYIDLGWRIMTGLITVIMFYFAWRKHRRGEMEHTKKMELMDQELFEYLLQKKQNDSRNT